MNIPYVFIQDFILYLQMDKSKLAPGCYHRKLKMTDYIEILKHPVIHHPDKSLSKNNSHTAKIPRIAFVARDTPQTLMYSDGTVRLVWCQKPGK